MYRLLVTTLVAALLAVGGDQTSVRGSAQALAATRPAAAHAVTLITGDRVRLTGDSVVITAAKGREGMRFATMKAGGHRYVVPQDAVRLVASGVLDRRLFDVTLQARWGYDSAHRARELPLIIEYARGGAAPALAAAQVGRMLPALQSAAVTVGTDRVAFWQSLVRSPGTARASLAGGFARVWLDGRRTPTLDVSVPQIGAPAAWQAGYTGSGVSVAVLDTGVDATHPDLAGKVVDEHNFTTEPNASDNVGHGTHVAATIAGVGERYRGVAPGATLYNGKVCDADGCSESAILAGMQWAAADKHARIVNLSLGGSDTPGVDPLEQAVGTLTAQYGTLFVIAAGNSGAAGDATVGSPGSADAALTVGAVDKSDALAPFSSRGPRLGDKAVKPDITAPGVNIVAAKASGAVIGDPVGDRYLRLSGTSMATPHVAGAAALLAHRNPQWTAADLKGHLMASARPLTGQTGYQQGAGRVDVSRAITQTVTSQPASLSLGQAAWPHTDDTPQVRTLTYRNNGDAAVTVDLSVAVTGPDGRPAPAGMFTLSPAKVTVPAGGSTSATLTADTRIGGPDGLYSGQIIAAGGTVRVSTPVGIDKEVESHNLTLRAVGRDGATAEAFLLLSDLDRGLFQIVGTTNGNLTLRLPRGSYDVAAWIESDNSQTLLSQPVVQLIRDVSVVLDARIARPVSVAVPDPAARLDWFDAGYEHTRAGNAGAAGIDGPSLDGQYIGALGAPCPGTECTTYVATWWSRPGGNASIYATVDCRHGSLYQGYQRRYRDAEFATVDQHYAAIQPGRIAKSRTVAIGAGFITEALMRPVDLPGQVTERFAAPPGVTWERALYTGTDAEPESNLMTESPLRAGAHYTEWWNDGPFSPAWHNPRSTATRTGDLLSLYVPPFGDRAGHAGSGQTDTYTQTLYRNGELVGHGLLFDVPAAVAQYRLETDTTRSGYTDLTTRQHAAWTFHSGHVRSSGRVPLPLFVVRPVPVLHDNALPAGQRVVIPLDVQYQPGATAHPLRTLTTEVSYDDGRTWQPTTVRDHNGRWTAVVAHPDTTGYVSLRLSATDTAGVSFNLTVIHAYRLRAR
jgi:hypothetical protein